MEFIKNIKGDFILNPKVDFLKKVFNLNLKIDQPELTVNVVDIDLQNVTFALSDPKPLEVFVDDIVADLISKLEKQVIKIKKIGEKMVKGWDEHPEKFRHQKSLFRSNIFINKSVLTKKEYDTYIYVGFHNINIYSDFSFKTGCGNFSHYEKQYYVDHLKGIDKWLEKEIKNLNSKKIKKRILTYISKGTFELTYPSVLKYITIPTKNTFKNTKKSKPKFPVELTGDILNSMLCEFGFGVINPIIIDVILDEYGFDLTPLEDWELTVSNDGYHITDDQICNYTVTLTSIEGHEYNFYDSHCLITGYQFNGILTPD